MAGGKEEISISPSMRQQKSSTAAPCLYHKKQNEGMSARHNAYAARRDRVSFVISIGKMRGITNFSGAKILGSSRATPSFRPKFSHAFSKSMENREKMSFLAHAKR
jgi:hypothetical protein